MATTTGVTSEQAGALSTEKVTYRRYVVFGTDPDTGKSVITKERILAQADGVDKATGVPQNWAKAVADGFTQFSENDVLTYNVKSLEGIDLLVPDKAQQLYIFQTGLATVQTARANAFMKSLKEGTAEPTADYDQVELDLRVGVDDEGTYSINKTPSRRGLSNEDKLRKQLTAMGVSEDKQEAVLAAMLAAMTAPAETTEAE